MYDLKEELRSNNMNKTASLLNNFNTNNTNDLENKVLVIPGIEGAGKASRSMPPPTAVTS